jgi:hypothetical protein
MPHVPGRHIDNEAQIFTSTPMYMMQGSQQYRGYPPQHGMPMHASNMPFDELMHQEDWSQSFMDPALNMNDGRHPLGTQQFSQNGWR